MEPVAFDNPAFREAHRKELSAAAQGARRASEARRVEKAQKGIVDEGNKETLEIRPRRHSRVGNTHV